MTWSDGRYFEGEWKNDRKDGKGVYKNEHGDKVDQIWKEGNQVQ